MSLPRIKLLLVTNAFYPEISPRSYRATELAREFSRLGHEVVVITKFRNHDYNDFKRETPIVIKMWESGRLPEVRIAKRNPWAFLSRALKRALLVLFEYPAIEDMHHVRKMLKREVGYDMMISFAVPFPVHWGVAWAKKGNQHASRLWVADCGDPYMFARLDTFKKPFYFKYLEWSFCKKCDFITVPFEEMRNQFYPQFKTKIKVIPQGFNFDEIKTHEGEVKNDITTFLFAGSVIPGKRDLSLFLDYISSLEMDFLFLVYTNQAEWFNHYKPSLGDKLNIHCYIDRLTLISIMSKVDFLVNVDTELDSLTNVEAVPSKLIDYALSGRPILNLNSANLDIDLVNEFLNGDFSRQRIINKGAYNIKVVSDAFLKLFTGGDILAN